MRPVFLSALVIPLVLAGARAEDAWRPVGLGGGGGLFALAVSPLDARRMLVNCDMGGAYTSGDAGRTWRLIHADRLQGYTACAPVFHPTIRDRVYAVNGGTGELRVSDDAGATWRPLLKARPPWRGPIGLLYVSPDSPDSLFVGAGAAAYVTPDAGATWQRCEGVTGKVIGIMAPRAPESAPPGRRYHFIATAAGIYRSPDRSGGYTPCTTGLPGGALTSFSGGANRQGLRLYATVECSLVDGRLTGGVYCSEDAGDTWRSCMAGGLNVQTHRADQWAQGDLPQYRFLATTDRDPRRVYVYCAGTSYWPPNHSTVYRSDDGGQTWAAVLFSDPRFARRQQYNVEDDYVSRQWGQREQSRPFSMAVCGGDPDVVALCASAWVLRTDDGGHRWRVCHTGPAADGDAGGPAWACNGLVVTSTWNYHIDPHEPARHYICYTDIGLARSRDAGRTWIWSGTALPWRNTVYELAFDPAVPGRIWGAMSNTHDIPNANVISGRHRVLMQGGVARSDDFGVSWKKADLPAAPALSVVLDPTSPVDRRVLYASLFEKGVYRSGDGGRTWAPANQGLGHPQNLRCCKLSRSRDGTLFVLITAKRAPGGEYLSAGVGLYRSADAGATWSRITDSLPLHWPKDFTVKADDPRTILLSACDVRGHEGEGGLYRTRDGGRSWARLARKGREHFGAFYHPDHPGWIYMTLTEGAREAGLYLSRDDGATWEPFPTLPFRNIQRVAFDPARPGEILLTTFGSSILRGPAEPGAPAAGLE
jgi:photosystem II stability/assembly factor-like uncharacterized protein